MFETLRAYHGTIIALDAHLERLRASARTVGMVLPQSPRAIKRTLQRLAQASPASEVVLRVMAAPAHRSGRRARLLLMARRLRPYPLRWYRDGVMISTARVQRCSPATIPPQAKHTDLLPGVLAHAEETEGSREIIYRMGDGWVGEGSTSNLCVVTRAGALVTAPSAHGVLAGVTCGIVFTLAERLGLPTCWQLLTRHDVWNAAEVFLTNTTLEVLPVARYDGRRIGTGRPGPWTRRLHAAFRQYAQQATGSRQQAAGNRQQAAGSTAPNTIP